MRRTRTFKPSSGIPFRECFLTYSSTFLIIRSGKTLAFLIPLLETLFRNRFSPPDGPGAFVLSPTRELAIQTFQVLKVVGKHHSCSVGLLIGGRKDFFEEQQRIGNTNIIIATPGRLLQHLEQTPYLDMSELRMLVLDEADRILILDSESSLFVFWITCQMRSDRLSCFLRHKLETCRAWQHSVCAIQSIWECTIRRKRQLQSLCNRVMLSFRRSTS